MIEINYFAQIQMILSELFLLQENPEAGGQELQQMMLKLKEEMMDLRTKITTLPKIDIEITKLLSNQSKLEQQLQELKLRQQQILNLDIFH